MRGCTSRFICITIQRQNKVVAFIFLFTFIQTVGHLVFSQNDVKTGEKLPFTLEIPVSEEQLLTMTVDTSASLYYCPLLGKVISQFGKRGGRTHTGVDIKLKSGDTVRAALKGVVRMAQTYSGYGKLVILKHTDGYETYYAHLSKILVLKGDTVYAGKTVGLGGRTGRATTDHLHFEVRKNGSAQNPEQYFAFANGDLKKPIIPGSNEFLALSNKKEIPAEIKNLAETVFDPQHGSMPEHERTKATSIEEQAANAFVTIQKGDTLYSLAKRYGTSVKHLQDLNKLEGSLLKIGMQLRVN